jgi:DNA-binding CsgD family transcriptional regulator
LAVADEARAGGLTILELAALHDAARLGAGRAALRRLRSVAAAVDGPRSAAMGADADARLADDAVALERAGEAFAAVGEQLVAAEVLGEAARRFAADGRRDAARRTGARARALSVRCEGAMAMTGLPAAGPTLTPREQQVARMAAEGRSSKEIAAELSVSVRTVDNQLSRAYTKLGISSRSELAAALADHLGTSG